MSYVRQSQSNKHRSVVCCSRFTSDELVVGRTDRKWNYDVADCGTGSADGDAT